MIARRVVSKFRSPSTSQRAVLTCVLVCASGAALAGSAVIDPTFGIDGLVRLDFMGDTGSDAKAAVVDAAGYLYIAGTSEIDFVPRCTIVKLDASGELVSTFGDGGVFISDLGVAEMLDTCSGLVIDGGGNLFAAGGTYLVGRAAAAALVIGVGPDGQLLDAFGDHGKVVVEFPDSAGAYVSPLALDADGNLYVGGSYDTQSDAGMDALVIKVDGTGALEPSFGDQGIARLAFGGNWDAATQVAIDADGRTLLAGTTNYGDAPSDFVAARLTNAGVLDETYGVNGLAVIDVDAHDTPYGLALDAGGDAYGLVLATADGASRNNAIVKLDESGQRVAEFGVDGIALFDWGLNGRPAAGGFGPDGHLYMSGFYQAGSGPVTFGIAAVNSVSGTPVEGFGENGVFTHVFERELGISAQCFDRAGRLYVVGSMAADFAATRVLIGAGETLFANGFDP